MLWRTWSVKAQRIVALRTKQGLPLIPAACGVRTNSSTSPSSHSIVEEEFPKCEGQSKSSRARGGGRGGGVL